MEKTGWKVTAICLIVFVCLEIVMLGFFYYLGSKELEKQNECLYNVCSENPYAEYLDGVCSCYNYDFYGELYLNKTKYMK